MAARSGVAPLSYIYAQEGCWQGSCNEEQLHKRWNLSNPKPLMCL